MKRVLYILCVVALAGILYSEMSARREKATNFENKKDISCFAPTEKMIAEIKKENNCKVAYLTFDDGPSKNTKKVLRVLKEKDAVATFFLVGNRITAETEEIIKEAIDGGNAIGVHSYSHEKDEMYVNEEGFWKDYEKAANRIGEVLEKKPTLHRFPWGSNNGYVSSYVDYLLEDLKKDGVRSFDWNVSGEDSVGVVTKKSIMKNIQKDLNRYEAPIILLHDSATADVTTEVLGEVIDYVREQGYEFATLEHREGYTFPASWR